MNCDDDDGEVVIYNNILINYIECRRTNIGKMNHLKERKKEGRRKKYYCNEKLI